jgi:hypothetical protein
MGALHPRVGPEDQLLEILVTAIAVKFKDGHLTLLYGKRGRVSESPAPRIIQTIYNNNKFLPGKPVPRKDYLKMLVPVLG